MIIALKEISLHIWIQSLPPYCLDYMLDSYRDETRDNFYIRYLNRRYKNDDFKYQGDDGIDDLCVEMMIYSHVWESESFLI